MKMAKMYVIVSQGIMNIIVLTLLGFLTAKWMNLSGVWIGIISALGAILGIIIFIMYILKMGDDYGNKKTS